MQRGFERLPRHSRRTEAGYNLVETLIAMALLGSVLIGIVTLFVFGRSNVYSGKQMSAGVSVATRVMEDLSILTLTDIVTFFELTGKSGADYTGANQKIGNENYTNAIFVTVTGAKVGGTPSGGVVTGGTTITQATGLSYMNNWGALMPSDKFSDGRITFVIRPFRNGTADSIANSNILQIRTIVEWNEARRPRKVVIDTVKLDRSRG
ncbi:MAG TPA: hypothetical protein VFL80_04480 [Thermoanaerobaculia bacterium]|nr:hypothetical protein [Thermoanaerobaculia bacterium]